MTKISEAIKYYKSIKTDDCFGSYFTDPTVDEKLGTLEEILKAIGDVDLKDDYLKTFMYELRRTPIGEPYERSMERIKVLYDLCEDVEMSIEDLRTLIGFYQSGPYKLMFKDIKTLISSGSDIPSGIMSLIKDGYDIARDEATKLDYLMDEYGKTFIKEIQQIVVEECLTADDVLKILPSKELIDSSEVRIPGLHYSILSGEDIVTRRLKYLDVEKDYQETLPDSKIKLGYCSHGDTIFTTFTKREYEEDLKSVKKLIKMR